MADFMSLGLKKEIVAVLSSLKYKKPLEVQEKIIPLTVQGKNVVFTAQTGSGKTLAYTVGFLSRLNVKMGLQMLVLVPTRELCVQVGKEIKRICDLLGINVGVLYGGRSLSGDRKTLERKNQIIVGTPGRIIQHVNERSMKIGDLKFLVYDESDQMFDNGFYKDCRYVRERVGKQVQIVLASATMTPDVFDFIEKVIVDYEAVRVGDEIPKNIIQEKVNVEIPDKNELLLKVLKSKDFKRAMIFCNTKVKCYLVTQLLRENKINARSLNSDMNQNERNDCLNLFKEGKIGVLVVTDVAARGLHIEKVDIIVNYDVPTRTEFYVHRIGRTGRRDKKGYSLTFICSEDEERFNAIEEEYELDIKEIGDQ